MITFIRRLIRRQPHRCTEEELGLMSTTDLRALHSNIRCRENPELLVMVWSELAFREQLVDDVAITINIGSEKTKPAEE